MARKTRLWIVPALVGLIALVAVPWRESEQGSMKPGRPTAAAVEIGGGPARSTTRRPAAAATSVRIYLHLRPRDLDPHTAGYAAESQVTECLFESLLTPDPRHPSRFRPALAVRWERSADGRTFVFHLRRGVRWHDGRPFTASDVVFTFDRARDPKRHAPIRSFLETFDACEAIDEHTVRFRTRDVSWMCFPTLAGRLFSILPRHRLTGADADAESAFGRSPIGTGPYRLGNWDRDANRIELVRFADHWGPKSGPEAVAFKTYTDRVAALADFRSGGLDYLPRVRPDDFFAWAEPRGWTPARVRAALEAGRGAFRLPAGAHPRYELGGFSTSRVSFLAWNGRRDPCRERAVRIAMAHLLDRTALGGGRALGRAVTGDQVWFGPAYDDTVKPLGFEPETARRRLEEAGWFDRDGDGVLDRDGRPLRLRIIYPSRADDAMLQQLAASARAIGVEVVLDGLERGRFTQAKKARDFDGLYLAWLLAPEEDPYWAWHSSQAADGSNHAGYAGSDPLIETIRGTTDPDHRRTLLRRLQARIHAAQPVLFVQSATQLVAWSPRLRGVEFLPLTRTGWDVTAWGLPSGVGRE